jgi:hypothetical protein
MRIDAELAVVVGERIEADAASRFVRPVQAAARPAPDVE